jgi:hypothetical protein
MSLYGHSPPAPFGKLRTSSFSKVEYKIALLRGYSKVHVFELPGFLSKGYTTIYGFLVSSIFYPSPLFPYTLPSFVHTGRHKAPPNRGKLSHCCPYIIDNRAKKNGPLPGGPYQSTTTSHHYTYANSFE